MLKNHRRVCVVLFVALLAQAVAQAAPPRGSITIDNISTIKFPTDPAWSPDAKRIAFLWDAAGKQDLFVVEPGGKPQALTDFPVDSETLLSNISKFEWVDSDRVLFGREGQLWEVSISTKKPTRVSGLDGAGQFVLAPNKKVVVFTRRGSIWSASLDAKTLRQITELPDGLGASGLVFSPDGQFIAFNASRSGVEVEELRYNGDRIRSVRNVSADGRAGIVALQSGDPVWLPATGEARSSLQWTADGDVLAQLMSPDRKTREIVVMTPLGATRKLWKDHDSAWWSPTAGARTVVSPDGKSVAFFSDRSGWIHLYTIPVSATSEAQAKQLTKGNYGTGYASWSPDSKRLVVAHSLDGNQMERLLRVVDVATGKAESVAEVRGVSFDPVISPDGRSVVFSRTAVEHSLELYSASLTPGEKPMRLTNSMPADLRTEDLTTPQPVNFPSRVDAKPVPATLMVNKNLDKTRKHPAIVWIHGSGSDQNYLGWHPGSYRMYYSVHQYLAQQGYVILTPDYRGSSGYSRDWATGHYMDLGGKDYLDVASGADYLKTLDYVDPERIGVWGLSYGGFMTLQAVTVTPTLFQCAINVAGVGDWATWSSGAWTVARMGTPVSNPEVFERSASAKHLDKLQIPLLILHGTADTNVAYRESLTVVDRLLKLGKEFDFVTYPGEIHFFRRAHILRDAWKRSEEFFDKHLRSPAVENSSARTRVK